jgi:hypothetical protein
MNLSFKIGCNDYKCVYDSNLLADSGLIGKVSGNTIFIHPSTEDAEIEYYCLFSLIIINICGIDKITDKDMHIISKGYCQYITTRKPVIGNIVVPKSFCLGGKTIEIMTDVKIGEKEFDLLDMFDSNGLASFHQDVIYLYSPDKYFSESEYFSIFLHELLHFIFDFAEIENITESEVCIISNLLTQYVFTVKGLGKD